MTIAGSHTLYVLVLGAAAISGWELSKWWMRDVFFPWWERRRSNA